MSISLKSITLCNFKSFRGKVIIGNILSFTAIIGPNGSGKSNIMDAISFALGQNKLNTLRVNRLRELVHGYLSEHSAEESSYVTIVLLRGENHQEKSFTRLIQGDNSQYKIDDKVVTRDFYMTELKEFGLNIKVGHFLVPQGFVQSFPTTTLQKELTAIFEEISGSGVYKAEYERLQSEFLEVTREVHFAFQTKKEQLRQKKFTAIEKIEAEKYSELQEQCMKEKFKFQLLQLSVLKNEIESLQNKQKAAENHINQLLQNKDIQITLLKHTQSKIKSLSDLLDEIEESIFDLENKIKEKEKEHTFIEDNIVNWKEKQNSAQTSLNSENDAYNIHKKAVQELENELEKITQELAKFAKAPEDDFVEFNNQDYKEFVRLKIDAEKQARDSINDQDDLIRAQQIEQYKLDNENRVKEETENKIKIETLKKEQLTEKVEKLRTLNHLFRIRLEEKKAEMQNLEGEILKTQKKLQLRNDIAKISEKLAEVELNNDISLQQKKKNKTIKTLKKSFSGVHNRLSNLCKSVHSRYNVALTKSFGRHMDAIVVDTEHTAKKCINFLKMHKIGVETFLPLDTIQVEPINDNLRIKLQQTNCKLLYDVLKLSSIQIEKAVLYAIGNTIVCETAEDARKMAFESDGYYNCVSLDGCFFSKTGIISGGLADLAKKAEQWEYNTWEYKSLSELKEKKEQLEQELRELPKVSGQSLQFDLNMINMCIKQLTARIEVIAKDIKDKTKEIKIQDTKLNDLHEELKAHEVAISIIQDEMQKREAEIKITEETINKVKDKFFVDFCRERNVPNITYYEKKILSAYKEDIKRLNKHDEMLNREACIKSQLQFENEFNENAKYDKILKYKRAIEKADVEYNKACQQREDIRTAIEQEETRLSILKDDFKTKKEYLENLEKELTKCESNIGVTSKSYLEKQKIYMAIQTEIEQKKAKCETILKECKLEDITIPMLETSYGRVSLNSCSSSESSDVWEVIMNIDFSRIPQHIRDDKTEMKNLIAESTIKLKKIQDKLNTLQKPNLKAPEKYDSIIKEIKRLNKELQELRTKSKNINKEFEKVKAKRCKLFSNCLDSISEQIDVIYKKLVNNTSAQALIIPENPEEPYKAGIVYSCMSSFKRMQPLQCLSDGEKSIANLALLFTILRYKPTPFFIMDEGDAPLDNESINNLVRFIRSEMNNMQIIIITLNNRLASHADILIGVTTEPDKTKSKIFTLPILGQM